MTRADVADDLVIELPTPLERARALAPLLADHASSNEGAATLARPVVAALHEAGLFHLLVPAVFGGGEASVRTAFDVFEEVSRADGASGWSLMAGAIYLAVAAGYLPDAGADAVFADGRAVAAGQVAPLGTATRLGPGRGWAVEGTFGFASGGLHASWFYGGFRELDAGGEPVVRADGLPSIVVGLFPAASVELLGNWDVIGLVGTGSVDYRIPPQTLDPSFSFPLWDPPLRRGHPRLRMGLAGLTCIGHAAFATGVARRALDELADLATAKRRIGRSTLVDDPVFQYRYAQATSQLAAARALATTTLDDLEAAAVAGAITTEARTMARLAATHAAETALDVAGSAFRFSGSTGLRNGSAIQRCYRDLSAGEQHVFTDANSYRDAGRLLLGVGPDHLLR
ncbi:MAG TPA: acyl-CoA dehydrogenase family protein [Acidimicrobiia bacterium]|nr:acyl-CoA dehydrogenase family protein [Acidimicrobiia bacterium]